MDGNTMNYVGFFILFLIGQSLVMVGSFISLPYKNLTIWQSIKMALPFVWIDWFFMTFAVLLLHKYHLLTNTQFLFTIIVFQFGATLLINKFYLKQVINKSDYVSIALLILAYIVAEFHVFSKFFNLAIPEEKHDEDSTKKTDKKVNTTSEVK